MIEPIIWDILGRSKKECEDISHDNLIKMREEVEKVYERLESLENYLGVEYDKKHFKN